MTGQACDARPPWPKQSRSGIALSDEIHTRAFRIQPYIAWLILLSGPAYLCVETKHRIHY